MKSLTTAALVAASIVTLFATTTPVPGFAEEQPVCVYISSYHRGLEWSDRIENGLNDRLDGKCKVVQYDMDTKRNLDTEFKIKAAAEALSIIKQQKADIVITSDDNAARYLIVPHLLGRRTPVVFTGINWTVEEYGFPVKNVTGMVEVSPLVPLIKQALDSIPSAKRAVYIGADNLTEIKNFERYRTAAQDHGIKLESLQSKNFDEWKETFIKAQDYDFVIMGNFSGITDWDMEAAESHVIVNTRKFSLTSHDWMMPLSALGYTTLPEEQGEWAAESALAILAGTKPSTIPIVTNRRWDTWVNKQLLEASGVNVPESITDGAKQH